MVPAPTRRKPPRPIFDAHVDSLQLALDMEADLGAAAPGQLDLPRARRGGLAAVVLVAWADPVYLRPERGGARARSEALFGELHRVLDRHGELVSWAGNGEHLESARARGRIAVIAGIEGGHSIEGSLEVLERFFERGLRVLTLVWNNHLDWIRSCRDGAGPEVPAGLSDFGERVVRRMNELGILVDLSHAGERSFYDALAVSAQPVIASHSGCKALHDHPRNLTDDQLRALARAGGVVGIVFCPAFLDATARAEEARIGESAAWKAIEGRNETETFLLKSRHLQQAVAPLPIDRLVDHVAHAVEVAGIDHVGLGSDYDGILRAPQGLDDASGYPLLDEALERRGFSGEEIERILYGNMARVFAAATGPSTQAASAELAR